MKKLLDTYARKRIFLIAEAGTAHDGSFQKATQLIDIAVRAGVSAVKFQHVIADEILHPLTGRVALPGGDVSLFECFQNLEVSHDFFAALKAHCDQKGVLFLCSPFGEKSAQDLKKIGVEAFKIASPESNDYGLWDTLIPWKKPFLVSTGVSTLDDIRDLLRRMKRKGIDREDLALMQCVTQYPAQEEEYNLLSIHALHKAFSCPVGLSDHTADPYFLPLTGAALTLASQDRFLLEKHITLTPGGSGLDDAIALGPEAIATLHHKLIELSNALSTGDLPLPPWDQKPPFSLQVRSDLTGELSRILPYSRERIEASLGDGHKDLTPGERKIYATTNRSLRATHPIEKGQVIDFSNSRYLRSEKNLKPGLDYRHWDWVGKIIAGRYIQNGEPICKEVIHS